MKLPFFLLLLFASTAASQGLQEQDLIVADKFKSIYPGGKKILVDGQYQISVFAAGAPLVRPRFMASQGKVVYIADMKANHIIAMPDNDGNGVCDTMFFATPAVDSAHSLAIWGDTMYVAEPSRIRKFVDTDKDGFFESEIPFITGIHSTGPYNHFTRTIVLDTINKLIYLSVGASCNACRESNSDRATILQFSLDGSSRTIYAKGLRNALGLALDPELGTLWAANADRDGLGDNVPPEIITSIKPGGFYGWPYAYGDHQWVDFNASADYQALLPITSTDSVLVSAMPLADIFVESHTTPMGILFYNDPRVYIQPPPKTIFLARHGSSPAGRTTALGYDVLRFQFDLQGTPHWNRDTLVSGFLTDTVNYQYWGRPCGIIQDTTSSKSIYLSSDAGIAAIYRISLKDFNSVRKTTDLLSFNISCFPNPTTGKTRIIVSSGAHRNVSVAFYDEAGHSVRGTILGEYRDEKETTFDFDFATTGEANSVSYIVVDCDGIKKVVSVRIHRQ
jgi:glucose/arabinose dehydrogenase